MNDFQVLPANTKGKKPLACWQMLAGYGNERYNGEKLFGQDQLVFTRHPQQVALAGVFDFNRRCAAENQRAVEAGSDFSFGRPWNLRNRFGLWVHGFCA